AGGPARRQPIVAERASGAPRGAVPSGPSGGPSAAGPTARRGVTLLEKPARGRGRPPDGSQPSGHRRAALPRIKEAPRATSTARHRRNMNRETTDTDREQRLNEVLLAYVEAAQAGGAPDRRRLLGAHPDLRAELEEFFAGHDEVERLAAPLREAVADCGLEDASALRDPPSTTHPGAAPPEWGQLGDFRL